MHAYTSANKTIADLQTQKVSHCNTLRAQTKLSYEVPFWYLEIGHPLWPNNGGLILQNARFSWLNIKHMHAISKRSAGLIQANDLMNVSCRFHLGVFFSESNALRACIFLNVISFQIK